MYNMISKYIMSLSILLLLPGCFGEQKKEGLFVINVLDADYFNDCHIKDSINVSVDGLDKFVANLDKDKSELVIYCSNYMCTASGFGAKKLQDMGFSNVWAYEAGMAEWHQKGLPVEGKCTKPYLKKIIDKKELEESSKIRIISTDELARKMKL
ncbi:MAG: rhodanese-like domain-containing protein [Candidatus Dependentiae bacterium]